MVNYLSNNWVCIDFETTNKDYGHAKNPDNKLLLCVLYNNKTKKIKRIWTDEYHLFKAINADVSGCDFIVAHNAKFELQWLKRSGFILQELPPVWCTQQAEYVIEGNKRPGLSLDACMKRRKWFSLGKDEYVQGLMNSGVCPSEIPGQALEDRCVKDVKSTYVLFIDQRAKMKRLDLIKAAIPEFEFIPVAADIEMIGMHLNSDKVIAKEKELREEIESLSKTVDGFTGGINWKSPKQIAKFLYSKPPDGIGFKELTENKYGKSRVLKTNTGRPLTDKDTISKLKDTNIKQTSFKTVFLKLRDLEKQYNTYVNIYSNIINNSSDNILRGNINTTIAGTHRLSSSNPNLQNQPSKLKELFCPRNAGWPMITADYRQLEFRVAAVMGNDPVSKQEIRDNYDIHAFTAQVMDRPRDKEAKAHTFKPLYGGMSGTPVQQKYYKAFREKYGAITQWQEDNKAYVLSHKELVTPTGLRFYWPDTRMTSTGYIINSTQICNYPVQYMAALITKISCTLLWRELYERKMKSFLVNTVHDNTVSEVHPKEENIFAELLDKVMTKDVLKYMQDLFGFEIDVPLDIEIEKGDCWV